MKKPGFIIVPVRASIAERRSSEAGDSSDVDTPRQIIRRNFILLHHVRVKLIPTREARQKFKDLEPFTAGIMKHCTTNHF